MSLRGALGGPWATHWMLWLGLYPPATLIVLLRESTTTYPAWWWPLLSATVQHLVAGVIVLGGAAIARHRRPVLAVGTFAAIWGLAAAVRGLIGAVVAEEVAGVGGDLLFRVGAWLVVTAVWLPAIVYAIALIDRRRLLIGKLEAAQQAVDAARRTSVESRAETHDRLARTVRQSVTPVLEDLRRTLTAARHDLDGAVFRAISARLSALLDETARLVDQPPTSMAPRVPAPRRASLRETFDVPLDRPWTVAGLVVLATLALTLPDVWRAFGARAALEIIVSTVAGGLVLGAVVTIARRVSISAARSDIAVKLGAVSAASAAMLLSVWLMLNSGIDPITWHGAVAIPLLLGGLFFSCAVVVAAIVLARANEEDTVTLSARRDEAGRLVALHALALEGERHRLAELMHGPVQGRLAACVMALNFFSRPGAEIGPLEAITGQVLDHLAAAERDLVLLTDQQGAHPPN